MIFQFYSHSKYAMSEILNWFESNWRVKNIILCKENCERKKKMIITLVLKKSRKKKYLQIQLAVNGISIYKTICPMIFQFYSHSKYAMSEILNWFESNWRVKNIILCKENCERKKKMIITLVLKKSRKKKYLQIQLAVNGISIYKTICPMILIFYSHSKYAMSEILHWFEPKLTCRKYYIIERKLWKERK